MRSSQPVQILTDLLLHLCIAVCLLMPLQGWLTSLAYSIYHEYREVADERTNLLTEIVNSIKIIKFFGWEQRFLDKADSVRGRELWLSVKRQSIITPDRLG